MLLHVATPAFFFALAINGNRIAANMAMIAITTNNSISVKPFLDSGQKLLIDNLRVSMEATPPTPTSEIVDDFEDGIDSWWRYSYHTVDGTPYIPGATTEWTQPGNGGGAALKITQGPAGSTSGYIRKTMLADWTGYKTLAFDAMMFNSLTSQGFQARLRNQGTYQPMHPFSPTTSWETFKIDISDEDRDEVTGLLFYLNGTAQSNGQVLFLDNIRLSTEPAEEVVGSVGAAKAFRDGTEVKILGALATGCKTSILTDPYYTSDPKRNIFFLEDLDRSSGLVVIVGKKLADSATAVKEVAPGDRVTVGGFLMTSGGQRFLYAKTLEINTSENELPEPVFMTNKNAAGESVTGGAGLDNTGMLVTLAGRLTYGGMLTDGTNYYYLNDGSDVPSDVITSPGVKVYVPMGEWLNEGSYIRVTGYLVNEYDSANKTVIRTLWVRSYDYNEIYP